MDRAVSGTGFAISVVIPTRVGWPHMRRSVDAVLPQLAAANGELIVVDASGLPAADASELGGRVRWLHLPRVPSYGLREAGYRAATAPIVAITEDHCAPSPTWLADIVTAHEGEPDSAAIFGLVANGSRDKAVDWALYSVGYLSWAPPEPAEKGTPGHANLSFKSWVFEAVPQHGEQLLEFLYVTALRDAGYRIVGTDKTLVTHFQSAGLLATAALVFHNGRMIGGLRRGNMSGRDWTRTLAPGLIAAFRTARTARLARTKPDIEDKVVSSLPLIAVLHLAHALGESLGYLGGPGLSGQRVH